MSEITPAEWTAILLSLRVAVVATLVATPFGIALAWLLARRDFWGKPVLDALVHLPLVLPPVVTGYLLLLALGRRGLVGAWLSEHLGIVFAFRWTGAALAAGVMGFPLMVRALRLSFEAARPTLRKEAIPAVDAIASWLRAHPGARIQIAVHTDAQGAAEWNLRLSQARAEAVRDALVERKIAPERLVARGYGETQPIAPNTTVEGRRRNQRVEVRVVAGR